MRTATILHHLALAREHVARGEGIIERQRTIIANLERDRHSELYVSQARALLSEFESIQAMHIADRDRLERELAERSDSLP
jgi:hypothetical protein